MTRPIEKLTWSPIRSVLAHEAHDFTPWLADNLEMLADVLGLSELELVERESAVGDLRLDILAEGRDGGQNPYTVIIENQFGRTDHDHLGKLVTYAAKADQSGERVLAVWVAENPRPEHLASIEYLNRVTNDTVGWYLVSARFVDAGERVLAFFETHAEPNEFLRSTSTESSKVVNRQKADFVASVGSLAEPGLRDAGISGLWIDPAGSMIRGYLPRTFAASAWVEIRLLVRKHSCRPVLYVQGRGDQSRELNAEVLESIRERHGESLLSALGPLGETLEWHSSPESSRSDSATVHVSSGYDGGDPQLAAEALVAFARAVVDRLKLDGDEEFPEPTDLAADAQRADAATVIPIARCVKPGEWTTYGDLSRVAIGRPSAAMTIGNIARLNPEFPNPHRVLNASGEVPRGWSTAAGDGPDHARQLLEAEGVRFDSSGRASQASRVSVETLAERWRSAQGT